MTAFTVYTADNAPEAAKPNLKAARAAFGFVPNLQPTQQQVEDKRDERARQSDRGVQWQLDRLYDELLQSSSPRRR